MISVTDLSEFFVEVADTLVDDFDVVDFLDHLTEKAALVSGAAAVGLVLSDHRDRVRFHGVQQPVRQDARALADPER